VRATFVVEHEQRGSRSSMAGAAPVRHEGCQGMLLVILSSRAVF
jgi:hypothetical protein